ncbi:MAG: FAD:protein FMN transferase [Saprospiraceae bacterium]|nr:FAD:protein FMN transferase [Saprospiraceae bacterium]
MFRNHNTINKSPILLFLIAILIVLNACKNQNTNASATQPYSSVEGKAMGTTYTIKFEGQIPEAKAKIDTLLAEFNRSLSTYDANSTISKFNQCQKRYCYKAIEDRFFQPSLNGALGIAQKSQGAFDPTIMPVVNYYGFGYAKKNKPENISVAILDSLKSIIGIDKIRMFQIADSICIEKARPEVQLDLNASAPGHGVDEVAKLIESWGVKSFMIEIGGEVKTAGFNPGGQPWVIGINRPEKGANVSEVIMPVSISNKALATSGNYRNFYENDKIKLAHIIDPRSCSARPSDILSATIIADDCLIADGLATTCMVLGLKDAIRFVEKSGDIDAFFIYKNQDADTLSYYFSKGFLSYLKK